MIDVPTAQQVAELVPFLTPKERKELDALLTEEKTLWTPFPGTPQEAAYHSGADEIFYGGAAGGGKSDLLLGLACTAHRNSIVFRREYPQLAGLVMRSRELLMDTPAQYNGAEKAWRDIPGGRRLEFGAVQREDDKRKFQGRPHDLVGFDELPNFTLSQYTFLTGWVRTATEGQRTRVVGTGNPPTDEQGQWVIERWAPWLDPEHPDYPETPGKLRWYAVLDGVETEVENGEPLKIKTDRGVEVIQPRSRTFYPASVEDNPFYMETGYKSVLQSMPEPLRSQLLFGDFSVGSEEDPWQVIPTSWVRAAMERGRENKMPNAPLTQVGVDVARTGSDKTVYARRYGAWLAPLERRENKDTMQTAAEAEAIIHDGGIAVVDVIGVGAGVYDRMRQSTRLRARVRDFNASEAAKNADGEYLTDRTGQITFVNRRAWAWWTLRELLDPANGEELSLPDDKQLMQDLIASHWTMMARGIQVEDKEQIKKRLGRSPDAGDAVVMACIRVRIEGLPEQPGQSSRWSGDAADGSRWRVG